MVSTQINNLRIIEDSEANLKFETFILSKNKEFCVSLKAIKGIG